MAQSYWRFSIWTHWRRYAFVLVLGSLVAQFWFSRTPSSSFNFHHQQQSKNSVDSFENFHSALHSGSTFNIFTGETLEDSRFKTEKADVDPYDAVKPELDVQLDGTESRQERVFKDEPKDLQDEGRRSDLSREVKDAAERNRQEREVEYQRRNERIRQVCQKRNVQITNPPVIRHFNFSSITSTPGIDEGNLLSDIFLSIK